MRLNWDSAITAHLKSVSIFHDDKDPQYLVSNAYFMYTIKSYFVAENLNIKNVSFQTRTRSLNFVISSTL